MGLRTFDTTASALAVAGAMAMLPASALAQSASAQSAGARPASASQEHADTSPQSGDIVVTAQRREEKSRDVPITITSLSQDQLATANVNSLSDTAKLTPGLRFDYAGSSMQPTIRGVGTAIATSGSGPNVGIYVDGFFQSNTYTSDFDLMRVKDIEVLKGPQGTLFGRNTTGGAIIVTTADPSATSSEQLKVSYGRFDRVNLQGYVTTALTKDIAWDLEGNFRRGDGFSTNIVDGDSKVGKYQNWSIRTGLKAQLGDSVSLLLRYFHSETNDPAAQDVNAYVDSGSSGFLNQVSAGGKAYYGLQSTTGLPLVQLGGVQGAYGPIPGSYATAPGQVALPAPVSFRTRSDALQATLRADLGFANLISYTQYRFDRSPYYGDLDATTLNIFHILVDVYDATFSQEFLLNSKSGGRLQWTAGANFFQDIDNWGDIKGEGATTAALAFPPLVNYDPQFATNPSQVAAFAASGTGTYIPFGGSSTKTRSIAAFADATYAVAPDKLFLTLGGRFSHDTVTDAYFKSNEYTPLSGYTGANGQTVAWSGAPYDF